MSSHHGSSTCCLCQSADNGPLSHICAACHAEVCPSCAASKQLSACPSCGDTDQSWKALQKVGSIMVVYSNARDWFRGVASATPAEKDALYPTVSGTPSGETSNTSTTTQNKSASGELNPAKDNDKGLQLDVNPAIVEGVLDWLKDEVDDRWLEECVEKDPELQDCRNLASELQEAETLELVDGGKKCTSVIGANGDYRSGMAREAVAYLLKSTLSANKVKSKKTLPESISSNSTAAPSTVGSACPTQRSDLAEASGCPTQQSEKPEEDTPQSWRTAVPSDAENSEPAPTWRTITSPPHSHRSQVHCSHSTNTLPECDTEKTPPVGKPSDADRSDESSPAAFEAKDTWGFASLANGFGSLTLPMVTSWSTAANHCSKLKVAQREVVEHAPEPSAPVLLPPPPVDDSSHGDEWATDHFSSLENIAQHLTAGSAASDASATATADDECRSLVTSIMFPPVVPPLVFPNSDTAVRSETMPSTLTRSDSNASSTQSEVTARGACDKATCVGISSNDDVCPKGHDLRWHSWRCGICDKQGSGLRFGCAECAEQNLCVTCKKTNDIQKQDVARSKASEVHIDAQPVKGMIAIKENQEAPAVQAAPKSSNKNSDGSHRERPVGSTSKSVLSVQTMGTSSAANLLGGLVQNQGNRDAVAPKSHNGAARSSSSRRERPAGSSSKSVLSMQTAGTSSAAQLLGGLGQNQGSKSRSSSSQKAFESKSVVGEARPTQRRSGTGPRAGGSVLAVKNPSSSAVAGLLSKANLQHQ